MAFDPFGKAIWDEWIGKRSDPLLLHSSLDHEVEEMPMDAFFRSEEEMPDLEVFALNLCQGFVLDIGAGTGVHSKVLLERGYRVAAIDQNLCCVEIIRAGGVSQVYNSRLLDFGEGGFDTLLMLMNGIGLVGKLDLLTHHLNHFKKLLNPTGQIIFDSSDIRYLNQNNLERKYHGEISYRYEYQSVLGDWFDWLYLDQTKMKEELERNGWYSQVVFEQQTDQYLVRATPIT